MKQRSILPNILHRLALLCYIAFSLFPLFWLLKVSVTPDKLLYTEGVRVWPAQTTWQHYSYALPHSAFPPFLENCLIVSASTALALPVCASLSGYALSRFN